MPSPSNHHASLAAAAIALAAACTAVAADAQTAAEFLIRSQQTDTTDVDAQMALGRWAEDNALELRAADVYAHVLTLKPDHDEAFSRLSKIGDNADLPREPEAEREIVEAMRPYGEFRVFVNRHFIIAYDTDERFARERGSLLALTHQRFFDSFRRAEQRPIPLRKRLVCVLFNDRKNYVRYAREVDRNHVGWSSGYYSTGTNRVAFFDDKDNPIFQEHRAALAAMKSDLDAARAEHQDAVRTRNTALIQQARARLEEATRQHRFLDKRLEEVIRVTNASKTTHEATHQLAFNTGIQSPKRAAPFWLSEGMATNFEADDGRGAEFGPFIDNKSRRLALRKALDDAKLKPLRTFVVITHQLPADDAEVNALYAQAWGLFNFLFKNRNQQMRRYLDITRQAPEGDRSPNDLLADFARAFGPVDQVDREFKEWAKRQ